MPKKKNQPNARRRDLVREGLLIGVLSLEALLLVALVTYTPEAGSQIPLVGTVGHAAAWALWSAFGVVSFALVALAIFNTILSLVRKGVSTPMLRVVGGALMVIGACALVHQVVRPQIVAETTIALHPFDVAPGGAVGNLAFAALLTPFGALGALLLAVVAMCTGFAFATDWLIYEMLFDGLKRVGSVGGVLKRFWPEPAFAAAGSGLRRAAAAVKERTRPVAAKPETSTRTKPQKAEKATPSKSKKPQALDPGVVQEIAPEDLAIALEDPEVLVPPEMLPGGRAQPEPTMQSVPTIQPETEELPPLQVKLERPAPRPQPAEVVRPRRQGEYELPGLDLLDQPKPRDLGKLEKAIQKNAEVLQRTLGEFRVEGRVVAYQQGPVVTMLEVALAAGTKVTKIHALADDLAMALKVESVRIVAPIPGKSTVGVEIPNPIREDVRLLSILESDEFRKGKQHIPLLLGVGADGTPIVDDLASMPHLLLAGATGSGKSVCINTILLSVLATRTPDEVKMILIDPKQVELAFFANIPHLLSPVVTSMKRASSVLEWAVEKMEDRYDLLRRFEVRNIASYNELGEKAIRDRIKELGLSDEVIPVRLPYIVIVVDELADLMLTAGKEVEKLITRLAQKSRAVGIHVILATQRPSTDVITGLIKANMPTRIAFQVTSKVDSRVVLDQNGADKLLGMGDMLYLPPRSSVISRAQGTFVSDPEVKRVVKFLKDRYSQEFNDELVEIGSTALLDESEKDSLYDEAVRVVLSERRGSASLLQRALAIGYTRASRLLDLMRKEGVVGAYKGSKASDVLLTLEQYEQRVAERRAAQDG